jgi:tRNA (cytidine/uridine-2'-O-)-methyltransferase
VIHLVLVEPEIPPNTGNVSRLCMATRTRLHLVGPLGFKITDASLKRAGMDYWHQLDWKYHENWEAFAPSLEGNEFWLFTTKAKKSHFDAAYADGCYLIFGRESKGLPETLLAAHPDRCVRIPMRHEDARSLNLSTSAGIGLYEALRQTGAFEEV